MNEKIIAKLPGEEKLYKSINFIPNKHQYNFDVDALFTEEYLSEQNPSGCPPHKLRLKVNTIVMLIRNINTTIGLCNGTRMIIEEMKNESLKCRVLTGRMKDKIVFIGKMSIVIYIIFLSKFDDKYIFFKYTISKQ